MGTDGVGSGAAAAPRSSLPLTLHEPSCSCVAADRCYCERVGNEPGFWGMTMLSRSLLALALALSTSVAASPTDDVNGILKSLEAAFNKGDAKAAAALFADDADVINPAGVPGKGRAGIEKVIATDLATILKGTTHTFTTETVRELGANVMLVDAKHEAQNMKMPDGKLQTGKLHVTFVVTKSKLGKLQIAAARPYMFVPPPAPSGMGK